MYIFFVPATQQTYRFRTLKILRKFLFRLKHIKPLNEPISQRNVEVVKVVFERFGYPFDVDEIRTVHFECENSTARIFLGIKNEDVVALPSVSNVIVKANFEA